MDQKMFLSIPSLTCRFNREQSTNVHRVVSQTLCFLSPVSRVQNLCFCWQVFPPRQQAINMSPQNAHILTPKINGAPLSPVRHMAPTRTVSSVYTNSKWDKQRSWFRRLKTHTRAAKTEERNPLWYPGNEAALVHFRARNKPMPVSAHCSF